MGSMHPILFFSLIYAVALFLSILICSSVFYKLHGHRSEGQESSGTSVTATPTEPGKAIVFR